MAEQGQGQGAELLYVDQKRYYQNMLVRMCSAFCLVNVPCVAAVVTVYLFVDFMQT